MLFPIRCITCGKVINQFYGTYLHKINEEKVSKKDALDSLKIVRYCCRRMFLCHEEMYDYISEFDKADYSFIHDKMDTTKPPVVGCGGGVDMVNDDDIDIDIDAEIDRDTEMDDVECDIDDELY
jgi:DNA-directed RNA polymerase subunit N